MNDTRPSRRLALFFDGTWNNPGSDTNVCRLFRLTSASRACEAAMGGAVTERPGSDRGSAQVTYYHPGVGVNWGEKIRGGVFGYGLSRNIKDGYLWLAQEYRPGDELYLFGFSRGAYTVRSLVGLIRKCGIPREPLPGLVKEAYHIYREKQWAPDGREAAAFKQTFSWPEIEVNFLGVWDTVGALGLPIHQVPFGSDYYRWHDTELSRTVKNAYHALALDEHRPDFNATVWSNAKKPGPDQRVEQRWFPGAHADVGGGYRDGKLWQLSLHWIQQQAAYCGLDFSTMATVDPDASLSTMHDSLGEFAGGSYARLPWIYSYFRVRNLGIHETIDDSVWTRMAEGGKDATGAAYKPPALAHASQSEQALAGC